jgi:3-oxoacyl-[acyl-carrier-protein] synthase II
MKHRLRGPSLSPSTACTTGSHAIGDAANLIRYRSQLNIVLAGAAEACIHPLALGGFARARSLATEFNDCPEKASRPFDKSRNGFVIAEGAGILVLEELEHAKARGADIYAEVIGYGLSSDAHHITAPEPTGRGAYLAMKRALMDAGLAPAKVDYINAHATSTALGDKAENRAIQELFAPERRLEEINVSSTKGAVGHLLGASGAVEGIFAALAVSGDVLPPTMNLDEAGDVPSGEDKEAGSVSWNLNYVPNAKQETRVDVALSNSFGFGGTCASIAFAKFKG